MAMALAGAIASSEPAATFIASDVSADQRERFREAVEEAMRQASGEELPQRESGDPAGARCITSEDNAQVAAEADLVFLAVKPQVLDKVYPDIVSTTGLVVSIAAGVRIASIEAALARARVVRVMPNTPGLVGEMAAGYAGGSRATAEDTALVGRLLSAAGTAVEVPEEQLDAVTGVAGSGPAFVARLIEAFTEAGVGHGLDRETAYELVLATFRGTAQLLKQTGMSPQGLVDMVSSPNGTTVAGRAVLESSNIKTIIRETVDSTVSRAKELGS